MRRTAAISAALVALLLVSALTPVAGHTPDDGDPIRDIVEIVSITTTGDDEAMLEIEWEVTHANGHGTASGSRLLDYNESNSSGMVPVGWTIYSHVECEPYDPITVTFTVTELHNGGNENLGSGSITFGGDGNETKGFGGTDGSVAIKARLNTDSLSESEAPKGCDEDSSQGNVIEPEGEDYAHATLHLASRLREVESLEAAALANERIEVRVDGEAVGVVTGDGGEIEQVTLGGLSDPTMVATTDAATAEEVAHAEHPRDAVRQAVADGEITYRGAGPVGRVTSGLVGLYEGVTGAVGGFVGHVGGFLGHVGDLAGL